MNTEYKIKHRKKMSAFSIVFIILLIVYTISLLVPLFWGVMTSLKTQDEFRENVLGFPTSWAFSNYPHAFRNLFVEVQSGAGLRNIYVLEMLGYTLLYSLGCAFVAAIVPCIMAYLTAKFPNKFSKIIYGIVIITLILPIVGSLPSEIQMVKNLKLYDTFLGICIMKANFLGLYFLVFYASFKAVAKDFAEAAYVDGASNFGVFFRIMLPLVRNALFTIMLIKFIEFWNDYYTPLIFLPSRPTLSYGMYLFNFSYTNSLNTVPMKMTGSMIVVLPILLLFIFLNNKLMSNISMGGIKE